MDGISSAGMYSFSESPEFRRGCTSTPKDHGNCAVGEGGITLQEADLSTAVGVALNVSVASSAQAQHIEDGVIQEKRKAHLDGSSEQPKRSRAENWTDEETKVLLQGKLEAIERAKSRGKPAESRQWSKEVSELLSKKLGSDRSAASCRQRWDTMLKDFNAICDHDLKIHSDGSNGVRFWEMSDDQRIRCVKMKFLWEWYLLVKCILLVEAAMDDSVKKILRPRRRTRSTEVGANIASTSRNVSTIADPSSSQDQVTTIPPVASMVPCTQVPIQQHQGEVFKDVPDELIAKLTPIFSKQIDAAVEPLKLALSRVLPNFMKDTTSYGAQAGINVDSISEGGYELQDFEDIEKDFEDIDKGFEDIEKWIDI